MSETTKKYIGWFLESAIWICLLAIIFSPLYISSKLFFPFIVSKTIVFNIAVELMFVLFLILSLFKKEYRLKLNLGLLLFAVYLVLTVISSLLGANFYRSFWSNNERSEGIYLLLHLFFFMMILVGFLNQPKKWFALFDAFFVSGLAVSFVALMQFLQRDHSALMQKFYNLFHISWRFFSSSDGARLASTIGNSGYVAGFLVFTIFFGCFLFFQRKNIYLRLYYLITIALEVFIVFNTETRGGILALFVSVLVFLAYLFFFYFKNRKVRVAGWSVLTLLILAAISLFVFKDSALVNNNRILKRVASISVGAVSAQSRLMTWGSAWQGVKEKPILGWGYENFFQPFDAHFNPLIYRHSGSVIWFDRAHNIIFDRLVAGGIFGLISYLSFLFVPLFFLWRNYFKKPEKNYLLPVILTLTILAYFIQNLFIFEALVIYIPLFMAMAFISLYGPEYDFKVFNWLGFKGLLAVLGLIFIVPVIYFGNVRFLKTNMLFARSISDSSLTMDQKIQMFETVLKSGGPGLQEYRRQIFSFLEGLILDQKTDISSTRTLADLVGQEYQKQLQETPEVVSNYLIGMRFNNLTRALGSDRLEKNKELFMKAILLSPTRAQLYFEMGYTYLYLGENLERTGHDPEAKVNYDLAIEDFKKAVALNDQNFESYRQLASAFIFTNLPKYRIELEDMIQQLADKKVSYNQTTFFIQMINSAVGVKNYPVVKLLAQKLIEADNTNPKYYIQLALAYAYLGEKNEAIAVATDIVKRFGQEYKAQSDDFIKRIRSGEFK